MASKLIINHTCPYCRESVENLPDHVLKKSPHEANVEFVVTRLGRKQYFHTTCFAQMVKDSKEKYAG